MRHESLLLILKTRQLVQYIHHRGTHLENSDTPCCKHCFTVQRFVRFIQRIFADEKIAVFQKVKDDFI